MIASTVAALALAAMPFSHLLHLHPAVPAPDARIEFILKNAATGFRDIGIDGHVYTLLPHHTLTIKAPAGTPLYARSLTPLHQRGDILLNVTPALSGCIVDLR